MKASAGEWTRIVSVSDGVDRKSTAWEQIRNVRMRYGNDRICSAGDWNRAERSGIAAAQACAEMCRIVAETQ